MTDPSGTRRYWNDFYADSESSYVPSQPSAFAQWVADQNRSDSAAARTLVEVGFGTGRDSLWFARQGWSVEGYDFATSAVTTATANARAEELSANFHELDLYDSYETARVAERLAGLNDPVLYGRFLIHSLQTAGRRSFWSLAASGLRSGGSLYIEFRTEADASETHLFGDDHFRVFLDPDLVADEIRAEGGRIDHLEVGRGLATYKSEDPVVARISASWPRT